MFYVHIPICHTEYKKVILKSWDFIKLIIFTASSKTFLNETRICFIVSTWCRRIRRLLVQFGTIGLIHVKVPVVLPVIAFANVSTSEMSSVRMSTQ